VVPYTDLSNDLRSAGTTPAFVWITPNVCNDMHDCSVSTGDTWLKNQLPAIFSAQAWTTQNSVLFLVFDEDDGSAANHVAMLVIGPAVKAGYQSALKTNHYNWLATVESIWHLPALTPNDGSAAPMNDFWK
jgi:acid phosphatase